jgi:DNA (cytosine-5)-methyltransferase 1
VRPLLLDLFCGAGGAAMGYNRAGFDVVGVDIAPQPHYPFEFIQMDVFEFLDLDWSAGYPANYCAYDFDVIHASPPCQFYSTMSVRHRGMGGIADERIDLLTPTLQMFQGFDVPWVVENVLGAKRAMPNSFTLNGAMFGLGVQRARLFLSSLDLVSPLKNPRVKNPVGVYGKQPDGRLLWRRKDGTEHHAASSLEQAQKAMGMDWADWHGTKEAIPPAYTEYIGKQLIEVI